MYRVLARAAATRRWGRPVVAVGLSLFAAVAAAAPTAPTLQLKDNLYGAKFIDAKLGWVVGAFGTIARTTDGGETWQTAAVEDDPTALRHRLRRRATRLDRRAPGADSAYDRRRDDVGDADQRHRPAPVRRRLRRRPVWRGGRRLRRHPGHHGRRPALGGSQAGGGRDALRRLDDRPDTRLDRRRVRQRPHHRGRRRHLDEAGDRHRQDALRRLLRRTRSTAGWSASTR